MIGKRKSISTRQKISQALKNKKKSLVKKLNKVGKKLEIKGSQQELKQSVKGLSKSGQYIKGVTQLSIAKSSSKNTNLNNKQRAKFLAKGIKNTALGSAKILPNELGRKVGVAERKIGSTLSRLRVKK